MTTDRSVRVRLGIGVLLVLTVVIAIGFLVVRSCLSRSIRCAIDEHRFSEAYSLLDDYSGWNEIDLAFEPYHHAYRSDPFIVYLLNRWPNEVGRLPKWATGLILLAVAGERLPSDEIEHALSKVDAAYKGAVEGDDVPEKIARELKLLRTIRGLLNDREDP